MTRHRDRTIALVRLATPEDLAESIAGAVGRVAAVVLMQAALDYLKTAP